MCDKYRDIDINIAICISSSIMLHATLRMGELVCAFSGCMTHNMLIPLCHDMNDIITMVRLQMMCMYMQAC